MTKVLEVKNITKIYKIYKSNLDRLKEIFTKKIYYKKFIANDDISFDLHEGETLGIIGMNGAGKSTILKQIVGVVVPTSGEIIRHGRVTALLELGTGFNDELSGYENIFMNGTLIGMSYEECKKNAQNIIDFSELGEYIDEPVKTYSSGMKMRLAFSIAIYSEPKILIVDEALAVGDAHFSAKCTQALKERKEKNMSIIYVSHDLNSLKLLCDTLILLDKGKIVERGNPEHVMNRYYLFLSQLGDDNNPLDAEKSFSKGAGYGNLKAKIKKVTLRGKLSKTNTIESGEKVIIEILVESFQKLDNVTVGIHIRDKFGQDIFGTNTYYQKIPIQFDITYYRIQYEMVMNIGLGCYSIGASLHEGKYHTEGCYHWLDFAEEFEVAGIKGKQFIGMCRLEPTIEWSEYKKDNEC